MKYILLKLISLYQKTSRYIKRSSCVFYPSCSLYAKTAIEKYGSWKGGRLALLRILRCHPWQKNHIDPVK